MCFTVDMCFHLLMPLHTGILKKPLNDQLLFNIAKAHQILCILTQGYVKIFTQGYVKIFLMNLMATFFGCEVDPKIFFFDQYF